MQPGSAKVIRTQRSLAILIAGALSACGGSGSSSPGGRTQARGFVRGTLALAIPAKTTSVRHGGRLFLSPSAASVSIAITGMASPTVADVSASSPSCTTTGGTRNCAIALIAPPGAETFTATLYTGAGASGSALGTGSAEQQIVIGSPFTISIGIEGSAASIELSVAKTQFAAGTPAATSVTVDALDAGGNVITGTYEAPITLTDSDTTGTFTLSPLSVSNSATVVTLTYSGGTGATSATISADSANVPQSSVAAQVVTVAGAAGAPSPSPTTAPTPVPPATPTAAPTGRATATPSAGPSASSTPTSAPGPTQAPTASPVPQVVVTPTALVFNDTATTQTFAASETGYAGAFTAVSSDTTVATVAAVNGSNGRSFTVTPVGPGTATITVDDAEMRSATVSVTVTTTTVTGQ